MWRALGWTISVTLAFLAIAFFVWLYLQIAYPH
jgi:hypothetical protein